MLQIGWLKQHLFLTVLRLAKSKIKAQADSVSGEEPLLVLQAATFLLYPHTATRSSTSLEEH